MTTPAYTATQSRTSLRISTTSADANSRKRRSGGAGSRPWQITGARHVGTWLLALATFAAGLRGAWYRYRSSQVIAVPSWSALGQTETRRPVTVPNGMVGRPHKSCERCPISQQMGCHLDSRRRCHGCYCDACQRVVELELAGWWRSTKGVLRGRQSSISR
jgi:hypothetical protein